MLRVALALVLAGLVSACSGGVKVTSAEYGAEWPFTIYEGTLDCQRESARSDRLLVTLNDGNGIMYGLNGSAQSFGYPEHRAILKPGKTGADVQPFIERGLTLCQR